MNTYKPDYEIEEEPKDFYNDTDIQHTDTDKCCLCGEIFDTNDLKTICDVLVCKECEVLEDNINDFGTIEKCIRYNIKHGYIKTN
jgi:hypothetical protein